MVTTTIKTSQNNKSTVKSLNFTTETLTRINLTNYSVFTALQLLYYNFWLTAVTNANRINKKNIFFIIIHQKKKKRTEINNNYTVGSWVIK